MKRSITAHPALAASSLAALVALGACGDNSAAAPDAAVVIVHPDAGFAEAPFGGAPQVASAGGAVLATPKIVPIFFTGDDAMQAQTEQFLALLAQSSYWTTTTSEYGVGPLTIQPTIVATDPPPTSDQALQTWLGAQLDGTHAGWTYDANAIYSVFLPAGVTLSTPFGNSCQAFGAYHDETQTAAGAPIVYGLMPRCGSSVDTLTTSTSHEFVEAATDPHPMSAPAFVNLDDAHLVWEFTPGGELGDMCEYVGQAEQRLVGTFTVQRTWSNRSAAAGHDPCVPVMNTPYASAVPVLTEDVQFDPQDGTGVHTTKGIALAVGQSKTIEVDLYSDAEAQPWGVKAIDAALIQGGASELSFAWDKTSGSNGDKLHLMITRTRAGQGGSEFLISSRPGGISDSIWFGFVADSP